MIIFPAKKVINLDSLTHIHARAYSQAKMEWWCYTKKLFILLTNFIYYYLKSYELVSYKGHHNQYKITSSLTIRPYSFFFLLRVKQPAGNYDTLYFTFFPLVLQTFYIISLRPARRSILLLFWLLLLLLLLLQSTWWCITAHKMWLRPEYLFSSVHKVDLFYSPNTCFSYYFLL